MASNKVPGEWISLIENQDRVQQVALESLKQNGCSFKETKKAIIIFEKSKGYGRFRGTDLMKIILNERDKEHDTDSDGENESIISKDETSKDDKENDGPFCVQKKRCNICYKSARPTSSTIMCDNCKGSFIAKRKRHFSANF